MHWWVRLGSNQIQIMEAIGILSTLEFTLIVFSEGEAHAFPTTHHSNAEFTACKYVESF